MRSMAAEKDYTPIPVNDFGFGLMTKLSPTQQPRGAALVSLDCDYNARNIANRRGYSPVLENGPGAIKVADFESGEAWSGGSADTTNFVLTEAVADGARGRSLSVAAGAGVVETILSIAPTDMGTGLLDVFHLWVKCTALPATITAYVLTLRFQSSTNNYYEAFLISHQPAPLMLPASEDLEVGLSKYYRKRRGTVTDPIANGFLKVGSPDWTAITEIRVRGQAVGSGSFVVTVDNLHRTPGLMQDLFQFRRESGIYAGAADYYAVTGGVLYRSNGRRWVQVFSGFNPEATVYSLSSQNQRLLSDGITSPRVLQADGATVYRLGIVTPPKQMTATVIPGGGLPDGEYFAQVLFYSSKTGAFSAPDDRVPATPIVTIAGGAGVAGIRFSNLPVSTDPQVDWLVIGLRPAIEPTLFLRVSDGLFGDVANGTTTFDFTGPTANLVTLQARVLTAIDPDLDYPSVVDSATGLPVEGHPLFMEEAGGYILTVMAEQPTVVRVSRFRQPASWQLDDEFPLGENAQERITGIIVGASHIIVMKRDAVYPGRVVGGDDKVVFDEPISDRGAMNHKGMVTVGQALFYRAMDGVYRMGINLVPVKVSDLAQPTWKSLWDPYGVEGAAGVPIRDSEHVVFFGRSLGALRNNVGWVTHYRTVSVAQQRADRFPAWAPTIWRMPADVACEVRPQGNDGTGWESWIGGNGQVFRLNYGYEDDCRPIDFEHRTALITPHSSMSHFFRFVDVEAFCSGGLSLEVSAFLGMSIGSDALATLPLAGNAIPLGTFVTGTDKTGAPPYVSQRMNLPPRVARYISLSFRLRARARVELYRVEPWFKSISSRRATA